MKMVNKISIGLSILFLFVAFTGQAQKKDKTIENKKVLVSIDGEEFTAGEFMYVYNKNNRQGAVLDKKTIQEYLDLYVDFRLKVKEAEARGMDTIKSFQNELSSNRAELAKPKLRDSGVDDDLMEEAYNRLMFSLRASHIMIAIPEDVDDDDDIAIAARAKLNALRDSAKQGISFKKLAMRHSDDPSARPSAATQRRPANPGNGGDLGYFTAFYMVYPFETAAYGLEIGEISEPVRTQYGYHIIRLTDKISELGKIRAAHINVKPTHKDSKEDSINTKSKALEIYMQIMSGKITFEEAAKKYSDDRGSAVKGGELPWFEINRMIPDFVKGISRIDTIGGISAPVYTMYGWHIIKLLELKKTPAYEDHKSELKKRVARDSRSHKSQEIAIENFKKEFKFKAYTRNFDKFHNSVDSSLVKRVWSKDATLSSKALKLFKLDGKVYTSHDFAPELEKSQTSFASGTKRFFINSVYDKWLNKIVIDYKDSKLEEQDLEFRMLVREYHDGILLFSISQEEVWDKAIVDTIGLEAFHQNHKMDYMWKERQDVILYNCKTDSIAFAVKEMLNQGKEAEEIRDLVNVDSQLNMTFYRAKFEKGQQKFVDKVWGQKGVSRVFGDKSTSMIIQTINVLPAQPKELKEARGLITADYQNFLNDSWLKSLHEKFEVEVDEKVLKNLVDTYGQEK